MTDTAPSLYPEYDHAHEMRLVEAIIGAITKASRVGGRGAPILRSTEIIGALTGALGHFLALSDTVKDDDSFEQALDAIVQLFCQHFHAAQARIDAQQAGRA